MLFSFVNNFKDFGRFNQQRTLQLDSQKFKMYLWKKNVANANISGCILYAYVQLNEMQMINEWSHLKDIADSVMSNCKV